METEENDYPMAKDIRCETDSEFEYWIKEFERQGKPEQALIIEAQWIFLYS